MEPDMKRITRKTENPDRVDDMRKLQRATTLAIARLVIAIGVAIAAPANPLRDWVDRSEPEPREPLPRLSHEWTYDLPTVRFDDMYMERR